jgi:D-glycero-D-manno-heptose 1,7-bisphosphate phosphatase
MQLIILDRDGVINQDSPDYIKSPEEWIALPGSLEAIAQLNKAGYRVVVATNQSGLARGLFSIDNLNRIHEKMYQELAEVGGAVDAVFFCPHGPKSGCACRKPKPGMFLEISSRLNMPLTGVPAVGDSLRDLQAAIEVGAKPILVRTGKGRETEAKLAAAQLGEVAVYDDLAGAVAALLESP